jgi:Leucine-rich repeat (LRR) protein
MSLNDNFIYGLATNRLLNDVQDKDQALTNLGILKSDLNVIQGANQQGVSNKDLITVSGLNENIYPVVDRYTNNLIVASSSLQDVVGSDTPVVRGNLVINGQLAAAGITFNKLDLTQPARYQPTSISTAVNSAWSFFDFNFTDQTDLYYGNSVTVNNRLSVDYIGSQSEPVSQIFSAEIPTHVIQLQVDGETYGMLAQAGAPLEFSGVFQNFRGSIVRNTSWPGLYVSWRIQRTTVVEAQVEDALASTLNVVFNSSQPESRSLQVYYPASGISAISVPNMGLRTWPQVLLDQLQAVDFSTNQLIDVPNFKLLTPVLKSCFMFNNRFYLSSQPTLRRLGSAVGDLLPPTLETLLARNAFEGSMVDGIPVAGTTLSVLNSLPNLKVFRAGTTPGFRNTIGPDAFDTVGYFPDVALTSSDPGATSAIVEYDVQDTGLVDLSRLNNLRTLSPELTTLSLRGCRGASSSNFTVSSIKLASVNVAGTRINIMDMRNKSELVSYAGNQVSQVPEKHSFYVNSNPTDADYKFTNCGKMAALDVSNSSYTGFFPKLAGNTSLTSFRAYNTQMTGGRPGVVETSVVSTVVANRTITVQNSAGIQPDMMVSGVGIPANTLVSSVNATRVVLNNPVSVTTGTAIWFGNYVLNEDTLVDCANLQLFDFYSGFMFTFRLHPNLFVNSRSLQFIRIGSNGRLGGVMPVFNNCVNLTTLDMSNNALLGTMPTFSNNTRLTSIQLSNNRLTGSLPVLNLPNLTVLNLTSNTINKFALAGTSSTFGSLPRLRQLRLNFNQIDNALPALSEQTPQLERLEMQNNLMTTYVAGTLTRCNRLTFISFGNNRLNPTAVNNIILDVDASVQLVRRSGNLILTGNQNAAPSSTTRIISALTRLRAAGWQVQTNSL